MTPATPVVKPSHVLPPYNVTPLHTIKVYQHELIPDFSVNIQVIFPLRPIKTIHDLYQDMLYSIIGSVYVVYVSHFFRANSRHKNLSYRANNVKCPIYKHTGVLFLFQKIDN